MALHLPYGAALLPNGLWQPDLSEQEGHKLFIITIIFNLHLFRTRWFELSRKPFFPLLHNPKSLSSVVLPYLALPRGCSIMNSGTGCKVNNARQAKSPSEGYFILPDLIVSEQLSLVNPTKKKKAVSYFTKVQQSCFLLPPVHSTQLSSRFAEDCITFSKNCYLSLSPLVSIPTLYISFEVLNHRAFKS